jgi:putative transposase
MLLQHYCICLLSSFKYRIYPTDEQEARLKLTLARLCELYNELRAKKVEKYKEDKKNLTKTDLRRLALEKRRPDEKLKLVHSQVTQNVADRVYISFKNFFEGRARFPRDKKYKSYRSFTYPQSGFDIAPTTHGHRLYLSGIGTVRIFIHRPMQGRVNRLSIKHNCAEWYAIFLIEQRDIFKREVDSIPDDRIRGLDVGLEKFITLDNSRSEEYPKFMRRSEEKLKFLQRHLSRKLKGSRRWRELAFKVARLHLHIKRQREDYQNELVSTLLNKDTDVLVLEKLSIENMLQNHNLAKSLADASFGRFALKCLNKATMLGKHVLFVDPWGTSQFCSNCLEWVPKRLSEREHNCPKCGINLDRDLNSAKLIRRLGIRSSPPSDGGSSPAELLPLPSLRGRTASKSEEARSQLL